MGILSFITVSLVYFGLKSKKAVLIFIISVLALLLASSVTSAWPFRRIGLQGITNPTPYLYRINRFQIAMGMVRDYPLLGVGLGRGNAMFHKYTQCPANFDCGPYTPENSYLMILSESGGISFVCFMLFLFLLLRRSFLHVHLKLQESETVLVVLSGFSAVLVSMCTYVALYLTVPFYIFWIYCGMLASLVSVPKYPPQKSLIFSFKEHILEYIRIVFKEGRR